ncbi:MAG: hypothetical protein WBO35_05615 [Candidatus Saccharimonadales bacterium]
MMYENGSFEQIAIQAHKAVALSDEELRKAAHWATYRDFSHRGNTVAQRATKEMPKLAAYLEFEIGARQAESLGSVDPTRIAAFAVGRLFSASKNYGDAGPQPLTTVDQTQPLPIQSVS